MTKKQQAILTRYNNSNHSTLRECYKTCSKEKEFAYNQILIEKQEFNGYDIRILSYTTGAFSIAYKYKDANGCVHLRYHAPYSVYDFIID